MKADYQVNHYVRTRVRERRRSLGVSQVTLAEALGLTYQQIQKYEAGKNRISAGALWVIARELETPVSWFYPNSDYLIKETSPR
jgi:transcriptional regulator with XRE-family HTH domain